jgi:ATP-dependent DNA helicase DinG
MIRGNDRPVRAVDLLATAFRDALSGYEERPGQLRMAEAVTKALESEKHLFVEAGTGTGKTLAYLLPAILSGKKVIISTATKALQEQIVLKDLPLVADVLAEHGVVVQAAMMKGLGNYLCRRRLAEHAASSNDPLAALVVQWARETESGDLAELSRIPEGSETFAAIRSGTDTRIGANCSYYDECFVTRMRKAAEDARIVVVNHHLFFADLALKSGPNGDYASALPPYDAVIFDEAHQMESVATEFFGTRVSSAKAFDILRDARKALMAAGLLDARGEGAIRPALDGAHEATNRFFEAFRDGATSGGEQRRPLLKEDFNEATLTLRGKFDASLDAVGAYCEAHGSHEALVLVARRTKEYRAALDGIIALVLKAGSLKPAPPSEDDDEPSSAEKSAETKGFKEWDPFAGTSAWIEWRERSVVLGASPVEPALLLRRHLWSKIPSVIATSATLATAIGANRAPTFSYAKARLGARQDTDELFAASPFSYEKVAGLFVPLTVPEPSDPAFEGAAFEEMVRLIELTGGGAFVLCTSSRAMRRYAELLRTRVANPVLCQGEGAKHAILSRFRSREDCVLVATMSFWEGVDVPGRALRLVILDKIPFAVPSDPVFKARCEKIEEQGGNAFSQLSVPMAAITLKQGFGRLIRSERDTGIVAILDRRLREKGYGRTLLASLPPARRIATFEDLTRFWAAVEGRREARENDQTSAV